MFKGRALAPKASSFGRFFQSLLYRGRIRQDNNDQNQTARAESRIGSQRWEMNSIFVPQGVDRIIGSPSVSKRGLKLPFRCRTGLMPRSYQAVDLSQLQTGCW